MPGSIGKANPGFLIPGDSPDDLHGFGQVPILIFISPNSHAVGAQIQISLHGKNFTPLSVAYFAGHALATTFISRTDLTAVVLAAYYPVAGYYLVRVQDPHGNSNWRTFQGTAVPTNTTFNIDQGTYVVTGGAINIQAHRDIIIIPGGTYVVTGGAITFPVGRIFSIGTGSYVVTGGDITFSVSTLLTEAVIDAPPNPGTPVQTFAPPVDGAVPPTGPILSRVGRRAGPDDLIPFWGDQLTNGLYFKFYGQTTGGDGALIGDPTHARRFGLVGNRGFYALPAGLPADSMYYVWPVIGAQTGRPLRVNAATPRWTNDLVTGLHGSAVVGNKIAIHGLNLCTNGNLTKIHLVAKTGTPGEDDVSIVSVITDRQLQFEMPQTVGDHGTVHIGDEFEVWVQARGGNKGWGKCPVNIVVTSMAALDLNYDDGAQVNMPEPTGGQTSINGDSANFSAAIAAISGTSGRIMFQAGTYYLNSKQIAAGFGKGISVEAADRSLTTLRPVTSGYLDSGAFSWLRFNYLGRLKNITVDTTGVPMDDSIATNGAVLCPYGENVTIICEDGKALYLGNQPGKLKNVTLQGYIPLSTSLASDFVMQDVNIVEMTGPTGLSDAGIEFSAVRYCSFMNVVATQLAANVSRGRAIVVEGDVRDSYAQFTAILTAIAGNNGGEVLFWGEIGVPVQFTGVSSDSSGAATQITFPGSPPAVGRLVQVVDGKGIGQASRVASNAGSVSTLEEKWIVDLDGTSVVQASSGTSWLLQTDCIITGGGVLANSAACGAQIYQPSDSCYFLNNSYRDLNRGISIASVNEGTHPYSVNTDMLLEGTSMEFCGVPEQINVFVGGLGLPTWPTNNGVIRRGTTATGSGVTTIASQQSHSSSDMLANDHGSYTDGQSGIHDDPPGGGTYEPSDLWWNTLMTPGTAPNPNVGIDPAGGLTGVNIIMAGTSAISGFDSGNKP